VQLLFAAQPKPNIYVVREAMLWAAMKGFTDVVVMLAAPQVPATPVSGEATETAVAAAAASAAVVADLAPLAHDAAAAAAGFAAAHVLLKAAAADVQMAAV
jgi:hypothetical protein